MTGGSSGIGASTARALAAAGACVSFRPCLGTIFRLL
ncbi:hypothetical protein [Sphingopyxis sp. 113P3]|nr:hypothetical protein [Sphingopyxis sp. 113P3]